MAPALTAITDTVHFAQTDLVNWTLVTDGNGVMLIDTGFPAAATTCSPRCGGSGSASTTCARSC